MTDIAKIGFAADTTELKEAKQAVQALVPPAKQAEQAADKLSDSLTRMDAAAGAAASGSRENASAMERAAAGARNLGAAIDAAAAAHWRQQAGANAAAAGVRNLGEAILAAGRAQRLMARDGLNLGRQFSDIGVTLAMGMNPFMIAIQQGPHLLDIFQERALRMGTSVGGAAKSMGAEFTKSLGPFLTWGARIGIVAAAATAAFGLFSRSVTKDMGDVAAGMGLTEQQLKRVEAAGVSTSVTMGDVFKATFQVIAEDAAAVLEPLTSRIASWWSNMLDDLTANTAKEIKAILGFFLATYNVVVAAWNNFPAVFSDIMAAAANAGSRAFNNLIRNTVKELNFIIDAINLINTATNNPLRMGRIADPGDILETNRARNGALGDLAAARDAGFADADAYVDGLHQRSRERALQNRTSLIDEAAGDPGRSPRGRTRKESDPWGDLTKTADARLQSLRDEAALIGLTGRSYETLRAQQDLLAMAKAKDITLTQEQAEKLREYAAAMGEQADLNNRRQFLNDIARGHDEVITSMTAELAAIGLSTDAQNALRIETEMLADARARGILLTDDEIAGIRALAQEQAGLEGAIRRTREAYEFAKDTTRGFITDMRSGLQQGQSLWESFGNAVINVLNKIADKFLDVALDRMFESGAKGGGGGFFGQALGFLGGLFNAKGNAFDQHGIAAYAKGGAFTNSVVSQPTLFTYANGGAFGVMGEAGPEAVMPLTKGPDGSLGVQMYGGAGATGGVQRVEVGITAKASPQLMLDVETVAQDKAVAVTRAGLQEYDAALPSKVHDIAADERVR